MNTKKTLAVLLCAALALTLAACGAKTDSEPVPTVTLEAAEPEATETVAYDGPLYEISYERMTDTVFPDHSLFPAKSDWARSSAEFYMGRVVHRL